MKHSQEERVIALAGLFQAAYLVAQLAKGERLPEQALQSSVESLFCFNPTNTLAVFGGEVKSLEYGLKELMQLSQGTTDTEVTRYVISLLAVEKQLSQQPQLLKSISARLEHISYKLDHFSEHVSDILANVSGLYQDTISTLKFRVQVKGSQQHLSQTLISDKIRALLFAGVRAAILWRQVGGTKWQLVFGRGAIEKISRELLHTLEG